MKIYLTVGTDTIKEDKFLPICNSSLHGSIKPKGGLWLTEFNIQFPSYNEWVDFILEHPYILFYKSKSQNSFLQPCSIITLKPSTRIFKLSNKKEYQFLIDTYQDSNNKFSFEKLSNDYDGIYINIFSLSQCLKTEEFNLFTSFGVNSYILFHPNCIDYYYSGTVKIEPFDYESGYYNKPIYYNVEWTSLKKHVNPSSKKNSKVLSRKNKS